MTLDPRLVASYALAIAFEIIFPLVVGYVIHRRFGARWKIFLYGALVFLLSQLLTRIPLVQVIQTLLAPSLQSSQTLLYVWFAVLALSAGLFEEIGRYLGYRFLIKEDRTWQVGLMYGAGHGGLESMLFIGGLAIAGLIGVITIANTDFSQLNLQPGQLAQIEQARRQIGALDWWTPLLGAYERLITIFFHIALSILVLQTFIRHSLFWLLIAIAYHTIVDFGAVVLAQLVSTLWVEVALTVTLPLSLAIIYYFRPAALPDDLVLAAP
jgi:uncharacterized membrane protein YhfC